MIKYIKLLFVNKLLKSTIIYTIGDIIGKGIPFILLPIVARYLTPSDYGILTNFGVVSQIFIAFCALNTYSALSVSFFEHKNNNSLSSYISNLVYLIALLSVFILVISSIFSNTIQQYLGISRLWQILALITASSTAIFSLYTSLLRMQNRIYLFSGFQIFQSFISAILAILFVVVLKWSWEGRVLSIVIAATLTLIIILWLLKYEHYIFKKINISEIKNAFIFGIPLLPHTLSFWFKSGVDKIILTNYISLSANGVYSIALTLGGIISIFTGSFFNAYSPLMFKDLSLIDLLSVNEGIIIKKKLVKITYIFTALLLIVCICSYYILKFIIPILFSKEYLDALQLLPLLLTTLFFEGMYSIISGYIFYRKKTKVLGAITFLSSISQIFITLFFVKHIGIMGAVYSSCIVSIITFLSVFTFANTLYDLPWSLQSRSDSLS